MPETARIDPAILKSCSDSFKPCRACSSSNRTITCEKRREFQLEVFPSVGVVGFIEYTNRNYESQLIYMV